jgi:hypothetical protein
VSAYCATRSQAIVVGTEAARLEHRELLIEIEDGPVGRFVRPFLQPGASASDREDGAQMDSIGFSEYVNRRLATVTSQALAHFLEDFDSATSTEADTARRTLLVNLVRAESESAVRLTEHEEGQLDRLISAQPPDCWDMYAQVRDTSARHLLYMLRGLELAKVGPAR